MIMEVESPEELGYSTIRNNLSESSVADRQLGELTVDLGGLTLLYGEHRGDRRLRELIVAQCGSDRLGVDEVLVTTGAAGALFIISTTLLDQSSHLVVIRPNYATNLETPRAIGCGITTIDLEFEDGFRVDVARIIAAIQPNTRVVSITCPHNPTGTMMPWADIVQLAEDTGRRGCHLLVDETYRDLTHGEPYPTAASLGPHVIAVSSLSKAFGTPGLRLGWLLCSDPNLFERFLAAKEQIGICGSVVDERLGAAVLEDRTAWLRTTHARNRERLEIVRRWVGQEPLIRWVEPTGGVVCFPRLEVPPDFDCDRFYRVLLEDHGTYVGPGHWFEMPKRFMRIGYAWPAEQQLRDGLNAISRAARNS
jgi:aspartate/methionine/tyrosine aminotransferase